MILKNQGIIIDTKVIVIRKNEIILEADRNLIKSIQRIMEIKDKTEV
jgi:hypothetical protein